MLSWGGRAGSTFISATLRTVAHKFFFPYTRLRTQYYAGKKKNRCHNENQSSNSKGLGGEKTCREFFTRCWKIREIHLTLIRVHRVGRSFVHLSQILPKIITLSCISVHNAGRSHFLSIRSSVMTRFLSSQIAIFFFLHTFTYAEIHSKKK